ncbi:hypothetical protein K458DRAFT_391178 [Lentithecium fluviatile CBS 122367]|uniref:Uncharacterized protein n=1 Tax=Lentithecium fluviatile CBS 122367 TaxID=1168545 RepID=A0A6G1IV70_9PLEO|nr:hypothetical protein K458DRAFT_391178 [Lentithecium fluviatile CBS 122367]
MRDQRQMQLRATIYCHPTFQPTRTKLTQHIVAPDPFQGGRLEDIAVDGITILNDAGQQRTVPSVPHPDQINPDPSTYSYPNPAHAADNALTSHEGLRTEGSWMSS